LVEVMVPNDSPLALLVDANIYIRRAFHSLPTSIRNSEGRPINAAFGFGRFLLKVISETRPAYAAVLFDYSLERGFRRHIYPGYKANRDRPPKQLDAQFPLCEELCRSLGFRTYAALDFEADDLIASLAKQISELGIPVLIASTDKDLAQLVSDKIWLYDHKLKRFLGDDYVLEQFGVHPQQIPDLLGLVGDPVDNIPGVKGIGLSTARKLLGNYGSIDSIYSHLGEIERFAGGIRATAHLRCGKEQALLSKRLATLRVDVPVNLELEHLLWVPLTPQAKYKLAALELSGILGGRSTRSS
jgi:5'-3' exonuclease